jgi:hypothetical protein
MIFVLCMRGETKSTEGRQRDSPWVKIFGRVELVEQRKKDVDM